MPNGRKLILIADDDRAVLDALQFALGLEGFRVRVHASGARLLADPELPSADCLIVDARMPGMDGFEVLGELRARGAPPFAILLTSHATPDIRARAAAAGAGLVLEKPLMDNTLMDALRTNL